MSPAHGTLIKISNCVHLCLLAGLLQRQGPHHPRTSLLLSQVWCPPAMLRNGLENGLFPLSDSLTSSLEVKPLTILRKEGGCEEPWLMPWLGFWQPAMWLLVPIPFWLTWITPVWALPSQLKSDYYCPLSTRYRKSLKFEMWLFWEEIARRCVSSCPLS